MTTPREPPPRRRPRHTGEGERPVASQPARVLLAEDDFEVRVAIGELLEADGYEVHAVAHGAAMLDFLASWILLEQREPPVDVIVTDVRMPGFNGLSIVEGLRENGWRLPIIVMSAFGDAVMQARIENLGEAAFFAKPFDPVALEKTILDFTSSERGERRRPPSRRVRSLL